MYCVVEFDDEAGGGLAVVNRNWLTPRKKEFFWPQVKDLNGYNKLVKRGNKEADWTLFGVKRLFYSTDDFEKANNKVKAAEETSDLVSDEEEISRKKRKIRKPTKLIDDSDEDDFEAEHQRPPKIIFQGSDRSVHNEVVDVHEVLPKIVSKVSDRAVEDVNRENASAGVQVLLQNVLTKLVAIEEQNASIINLLQRSRRDTRELRVDELPVQLPIIHREDILLLENYLKEEDNYLSLKSFLASLGGNSVTNHTNRILKQLLSDNVAAIYNFFGTKNKLAFSDLQICKVVTSAVKSNAAHVTNKEVEDVIKVWLKHAPERQRKKAKDSNISFDP